MKKIILLAFVSVFLVYPSLDGQEINRAAPVKLTVSKGVKTADLTKTDFVLPTIKVTGNEQPISTDNGMAILSAVIDRQSLPANLVKIKYKWIAIDKDVAGNIVFRKDILIWPDGSQVVFGVGTRARQITVLLYVGCLYETKSGDVITEADIDFPDPINVVITVGASPAPVIPPGPGPTPTPTPVPGPSTLADGQFKIAQKAYDLVMQDVPLAARPGSKALADSFSSVAAQVAAGTLSGPSNILKALKDSNTAALANAGVASADWTQWQKLYGDTVYSFYTNKSLNTSDDWHNLLTETALGLSAVK